MICQPVRNMSSSYLREEPIIQTYGSSTTSAPADRKA
jgi:hypothetical protein